MDNHSIRVDKPWGFKDILVETPNYTVSRLHIEANERLSLQIHSIKVETLIVENNYCLILKGKNTKRYSQGDFEHIPSQTVHRVEALDVACDIIEVATLAGDEVKRLSDDYGRK